MADIFYTDATYIDDATYTIRPAAELARSSQGLRPWQNFVFTYGMILAGLALLLHDVVLRTGGNAAGGLVAVAGAVVIGSLIASVFLIIAGRMHRL